MNVYSDYNIGEMVQRVPHQIPVTMIFLDNIWCLTVKTNSWLTVLYNIGSGSEAELFFALEFLANNKWEN